MRGYTGMLLAGIVSLGVLCSTPAFANVFFFQMGETLYDAGPVPPEFAKKDGLENARSVYKCEMFSLAWAVFHRWDCEPAIAKHGTIVRSSESATNAKMKKAVVKAYPDGPPELTGWALHGRWVVGVLFVLFVLAPLFRRKSAF